MKLADLIHAWRFYNKMSVRETAAGIGIPESVLRRFEAGEMVSAPTLLARVKNGPIDGRENAPLNRRE